MVKENDGIEYDANMHDKTVIKQVNCHSFEPLADLTLIAIIIRNLPHIYKCLLEYFGHQSSHSKQENRGFKGSKKNPYLQGIKKEQEVSQFKGVQKGENHKEMPAFY